MRSACADVPRLLLNTTDKDELRRAADLIIAGNWVYQGIWMDQILEKLPSEEIVAAPYYNGDAVTMIDENPDLAFYVPKEGTNLFVDAMHPEKREERFGCEKFINFMCSTEAAMANQSMSAIPARRPRFIRELDEEITSDRCISRILRSIRPRRIPICRRKSTNTIMICGVDILT